MKKKIIIWGAGLMGYCAYFYYQDKASILYYVDSNENKWGELLNGIRICSPEIIRMNDATIVLAVKKGMSDIQKCLEDDFSIYNYVVFSIDEKQKSSSKKEERIECVDINSFIVSFCGGLGNQMFQYAFLKFLEYKGKEVFADLSAYEKEVTNEFLLEKVFCDVKVKKCVKKQKDNYIKKILDMQSRYQNIILYNEPNIYETKIKQTDIEFEKYTGGIISGLHQTAKYGEHIRDMIIELFRFKHEDDKGLNELSNKFIHSNMVSVHIRRGDYLQGNNKWTYGDICTDRYYEKAIKLISEQVENVQYCFFSNDIGWVKEHYKIDDAIYIERNMFDDYYDWYDMYLMSICKHNIIANSTFSWWGAWLNQNPNKIVIAPSKWVNGCEYIDIYPAQWIKL